MIDDLVRALQEAESWITVVAFILMVLAWLISVVVLLRSPNCAARTAALVLALLGALFLMWIFGQLFCVSGSIQIRLPKIKLR